MTPSVSVVIPSYNVERYIRQCLQSVLAQTGVAYELILIDDASTDRTLSVARELLDGLPQAKIVKLAENGGQARARNVGIDQANGQFVAFLDSDDFYVTNSALARWMRSACELSADVVRCGFTRVDASGRYRSDGSDLGVQEPRAFASVESYPRLVNVTTSWQLLYDRKLLAENGIRFSPRLRQREDRLFLTEALLKARRIGVTPERLIAHRIHPDSTMHNVSLGQLRMFAIHIEELNRLMRKIPIAEFPVFLRENLAFYYSVALGYWRPLIKLGAYKAERPAEVTAFIDALAEADWATGLLSETKHLELPEYREERFREGDADLLRALAKHGQHRLFCDVVAGRRLRVDEVLRLPKDVRDATETAARPRCVDGMAGKPHPH
jgi:glycosyltransferase involved in cell wall biosynthesis